MSLIPISVKSIKRGPIPNDGSMSTVLSKLGNTYKDSASIKEADPTIYDVEVEEQDDPEEEFVKQGKVQLIFALPDHTPEVVQAVKGGDIVNGMWRKPDTAVRIEESYQVITQTGVIYEIPRGRVIAVVNDALSGSANGLIQVTVTAFKPAAAGLKSFSFGKYQIPTVSAGNNQANVAANTANLVGTASASHGVISSMRWSVDSKPVGAADPTFATGSALATVVNGLANGVYKLRLTVQDENEFENYATVTLTVNIA